jgi:hypothetical protein
MSSARETNQVDRHSNSVTRLAAVALLVGAAVIGCARHDGAGTAAVSTPTSQSSQVVQTAPTPEPTATDSPAPIEAAVPSDSADANPTAVAPATPDPLDSELSNLNTLINGVNGSVSNGDAGTAGGE